MTQFIMLRLLPTAVLCAFLLASPAVNVSAHPDNSLPKLSNSDKQPSPSGGIIQLEPLAAIKGEYAFYVLILPDEEKIADDLKIFQENIERIPDSNPVSHFIFFIKDTSPQNALGMIEKKKIKNKVKVSSFLLPHIVAEEPVNDSSLPAPPSSFEDQWEPVDQYDLFSRIGHSASLSDLVKDYQENILLADDKYKNLPLKLKGRVINVARDQDGQVYVAVEFKGVFGKVYCYPMLNAPERLGPKFLKKDNAITVNGVFHKYSDTNIELTNCLFTLEP